MSPCSLSIVSIEGTPAGSYDTVLGAPDLYNPGAKSGVRINMSPPITPTTDGDSHTTCDWVEKKRVLQVNYYVNGVGEENFIPATILGDGTGLMRKIGYHTLRVKASMKSRIGVTNLSNQIMAGFLRGQLKEEKGEITGSALMCYLDEDTLEIMSCEARIVLSELEALEILPVLHLRERQKFDNLQELADQMITDLRCAEYLPHLSRRGNHVMNNHAATKCTSSACQAPPCTSACTQTCALCNIM